MSQTYPSGKDPTRAARGNRSFDTGIMPFSQETAWPAGCSLAGAWMQLSSTASLLASAIRG